MSTSPFPGVAALLKAPRKFVLTGEERGGHLARWRAGRRGRRAVAGWIVALVVWTVSGPGAAAISAPGTGEIAEAALAQTRAPSSVGVQQGLQQRVSATFKEVDFEAAMNFLAENAGLTIVLSPDARELAFPVTIHLVDLPIERTLKYLVNGQGLVYRLDGQAIYIATLDEMEAEPLVTEIFHLKRGPGLFADFEPLGETRESVALQVVGIRRMGTVRDILEEVIEPVSGSSILLDERSGALVVTHVPYYLGKIKSLLEELDVAPLEIRIETRFMELVVTDTDEFSWDAALSSPAVLKKKEVVTEDGESEGPQLQLSSVGSTLARGTEIDFTNFDRQTSGDGLNLTFQGVLTGTQYSAVLYALTETKKSKTLSAPQVTTLNNQTATIKVVTEFVYATRFEATVKREDLNGDGDFNDIVSSVRETRFVNVPQDFVTKDLGILLHVTPSVGRDRRSVILALKPEVSEKKADDKFSGEITLPRFTTRNLETTVLIEDGETVVLGGLMQDTAAKSVTRVPWLSRLPLVGRLFEKRSESMERSNLMIFVTAHILNPSGRGRPAARPAARGTSSPAGMGPARSAVEDKSLALRAR